MEADGEPLTEAGKNSDFGIFGASFSGCRSMTGLGVRVLGHLERFASAYLSFFWQAPDQVDLYEVVEILARDVRFFIPSSTPGGLSGDLMVGKPY